MYKLTEPLEQIDDINNLNKYKAAGLIATKACTEITKNIKSNIKLLDLVNIGNNFINSELDKVYKDVKYKGLSFPICLSLNCIAGSYIPNDKDVINEGDILKIELGVHIDGFPANIVYSTILNSSNNKITDKRANVMKACIEASKEIFKVLKPGKTNMDVIKVMEKFAEQYGCNLPICNEYGAIPGVFSFQMSRYICDGYNDDIEDEFVHRFILSKQNPNFDYSMREMELEENEVYAIDILMSTGSGKLAATGGVDIYKRNHENRVLLKLNSSKETLNLFNKERFPISLQNKNTKVKLGLKECLEKKLLEKYTIVKEKEGEYIARIKFTVIIKDNPILVCGKPADEELNKLG